MESMRIEFDPWEHDYAIDTGPLLTCPDVSVVPAFPWTLSTLIDSTSKTYITFEQLKNIDRYQDPQLKDSITSKQFHADKGSASNELVDQSLLNQLRTDLPYIYSKISCDQGWLNDNNEYEVAKDKQNYTEGRYLPSFETDSLETASVIPHLSSNCSHDDILNARIENLSDDVFETESDTNRRLGILPQNQNGNDHCLPFQDLLNYGTNTLLSNASYCFNSGDLTSSDSIDRSFSSGSYTIDVDLHALPETECALDRAEKFIMKKESDSFCFSKACQHPVKQSENIGSLMPETHLDGGDQFTDSLGLKEFKPAGRKICGNYAYEDEKSNFTSAFQPENIHSYAMHLYKSKRPSLDFLTKVNELTGEAAPNDEITEHTCHVNIYQHNLKSQTNNEDTICGEIFFPSKDVDNKLSKNDENDIYVELVGKKQLQESETCPSASPNSSGEVLFCNNINTVRKQNESSDMLRESESFDVTHDNMRHSQTVIETDLSHVKPDHAAHSMGLLKDLFHNHNSIEHKGFCKFRYLNDRNIVLKDNMNSLKNKKEDVFGCIDKTEIERFVLEVIHVAINRIKTECNGMTEMHETDLKQLPFDTTFIRKYHCCVLDDLVPNEILGNGDGILMNYCELQGFNEDTYTSSLAAIPEVDPILETYSFEDMQIKMDSTFTVKEILPSIPEICHDNKDCFVERKASKETSEDLEIENKCESYKTSAEFASVEPEVQEQVTVSNKDENLTNIIEPFDVQQVFGIQSVENKEDVDTLNEDFSLSSQRLNDLDWLLKENKNTSSDNRKRITDLHKVDNNSDKEGDLNGNEINNELIQHTTVGSESDPSENPSILYGFFLKELVTMDQDEFFSGSTSSTETKFQQGSTTEHKSGDCLGKDKELGQSLGAFQNYSVSENCYESNDTDRLVKHDEFQTLISNDEPGHVAIDITYCDSVDREMNFESEMNNVSKGGHAECIFDDKAIMAAERTENKALMAVEGTEKLDLVTHEQPKTEFRTIKTTSARETGDFLVANERDSTDVEQSCTLHTAASKYVVSSFDTESSTKTSFLSKNLKSNLSNDLSRRQEYRRHSRYQSQSLNLDNCDRRQTELLKNRQLSLRKVKSLNTDYHQQYSSREINFPLDSPLCKFNTYCMDFTRNQRQDEADEFIDDQVNDVAEQESLRKLGKEISYDCIDTSCADTTNYKITGAGKLTFAPARDVLSYPSSCAESTEEDNPANLCSDIDRMYSPNNFINKKDGKNFSQDQLQNQAGSLTKSGPLTFGQEKYLSNYRDSETDDDGLPTAIRRSTHMASADNFDLNNSMRATNTRHTNETIKRRNAFRENTFRVKRLASQELGRHHYETDSRLHYHSNENLSPEIKEYINAIHLDNTIYNRISSQCRFPVHFSQQHEKEQELERYKEESPYHYTFGHSQNCKSSDHDGSKTVKISSSRSIDYVRFSNISIQGRTTSAAKERKLRKSHSELSSERQYEAALGKSCFHDRIGLTSNRANIDQFPKGKAVATRDRSLIDSSASQTFNQNNGRTGNNKGKPTDTDLAKKSRKTVGRNYRDNISGSQRRNKTFNSEMRIQEHLDKRQKDGPLSLTDAYGSMETSYNQTGHALSQSANQLSESMTSLSNRHAPAMSPSRQNSLQKQQSLQSFHSEINGEHRHEEGVKFERLKNLPEEDLMVKIKEIIGHMERLEDYHRGDGMRIQKMLGDMYWDYTHMREMIGDCMADSGYAVVSMTMLKTLNSIGIFKNDDVWFPTYYTYNTMWNFTDASSKLAKALSENDAVRLLTLNCGHKPYINAIHSKNVYYVIKASLSILHNIARNSGMKHLFDENKTSETIMPFLESEDEMLKILATLTIANIVDEEENKTIIAESGTIHDIVNWIEKSLSLPRRRYKGFTPQELTEGLNKLAVNDANKMRYCPIPKVNILHCVPEPLNPLAKDKILDPSKLRAFAYDKIVDEGALQLFLQMLQHDDIREQSSAARIVWTLSFDKDVRQKINENTELVSVMEKLTDSTNKSLQTNCSGALWIIRGENDVTTEKRPKTNKSKTHVFLSYAWADKEIVLAIRDRLRAEGYAIWIDIEKMGKATLETMTEAIENSAVVLVCMSEKYKQSPNCRTEAEYTFQLKKDYIPLMMQKKYRPDGWVGTILGAKLYFDFSGKYPFEKSFQGLLKELRGRGKVTPNTTPGDSNENNHGNPAMVHSMSLSSHTSAGTPVHHMLNSAILNMGQEELIKWLRNIKLTECIPAFMEFDGRLLMQLKVMRTEAPEFFYQCLEKRLNMSLIEILKFTRALEELQ